MSKLSRRKAGRSDVPGPLTSTQKFDADLDEDDDEEVGEKYVARGRRPPRDRDEELFQKQLDEAIRQSTGSSMYDLSSLTESICLICTTLRLVFITALNIVHKIECSFGENFEGFSRKYKLNLKCINGLSDNFPAPWNAKAADFLSLSLG